MPVPPHLFAAARGWKRDFSWFGILGLVFPMRAGAERTGRMMAERARQSMKTDGTVPNALLDIVKDQLEL